MPVYKIIKTISFDGIETVKTVDVSSDVDDAQNGLWCLYDTDWTQINGVVQPISTTEVKLTVAPALPAGDYRLVGLA